jgi:predicted methyltransferase
MSMAKGIRRQWILIGLMVMSLTGGSLHAEEANVNPGINQYYYDAEFERWVNVFERPGRELYDRRHEIVKALELRPGMAVADIGAGTGLFTRLFSRQVGKSGRVYAVDISENFVRSIEGIAQDQGLDNIQGIVNTDKSTGLAANSIDLAFLADTYHHFEYPQNMLASIHRALRPGGRLVIIDFRKQPGISSSWVMSHVRADQTVVTWEVEKARFELVSDSSLLKSNYFLSFVKSDQ